MSLYLSVPSGKPRDTSTLNWATLVSPHECYRGLWDFLSDRSLSAHRAAQHKMRGHMTTLPAEFESTDKITVTNWRIFIQEYNSWWI